VRPGRRPVGEIRVRASAGTLLDHHLTKRMAEDLKTITWPRMGCESLFALEIHSIERLKSFRISAMASLMPYLVSKPVYAKALDLPEVLWWPFLDRGQGRIPAGRALP